MADSKSSSPHFQVRSRERDWQRAYEMVLAESDEPTPLKLIEVAEAAIRTRRDALVHSFDHHAERRRMEEALAHLEATKRERLKFPAD